MGAPQHVFEVYIRATPERLWQAITDPAMTQIYYFNSLIESDLQVGSSIQYKQPDGSVDIDGEVLEADPPPPKLVHSFSTRWEANDDPPTTVTWEITPDGRRDLPAVGGACRLRVRERDLRVGQGRLADHPLRAEDAGRDRREAEDRGAGGRRRRPPDRSSPDPMRCAVAGRPGASVRAGEPRRASPPSAR